jgi:hypothetical protein
VHLLGEYRNWYWERLPFFLFSKISCINSPFHEVNRISLWSNESIWTIPKVPLAFIHKICIWKSLYTVFPRYFNFIFGLPWRYKTVERFLSRLLRNSSLFIEKFRKDIFRVAMYFLTTTLRTLSCFVISKICTALKTNLQCNRLFVLKQLNRRSGKKQIV